MATTRKQTLHHTFQPALTIEPIDPVYELKPFVSGWFLWFSTEYKKVLVSDKGSRDVWYCAVCGEDFEHESHSEVVIKANSCAKEKKRIE